MVLPAIIILSISKKRKKPWALHRPGLLSMKKPGCRGLAGAGFLSGTDTLIAAAAGCGIQ